MAFSNVSNGFGEISQRLFSTPLTGKEKSQQLFQRLRRFHQRLQRVLNGYPTSVQQKTVSVRFRVRGHIFHASQKRCQNFMLAINNKQLKGEFCIRYLGILIDSHLNWKHHVECIAKKIRGTIVILSKLRYYVGLNFAIKLVLCTYIYPFLTYGIIIWGNTLQPIFILQRAMRLITFSRFDEHCSPLSKSLEIIKFLDLVTFHLAIFMYKYHNQLLLPSVLNSFFTKISQIHTYNTRLGAEQSYYLSKARTNYGVFKVHQYGIPLTRYQIIFIVFVQKENETALYQKLLDMCTLSG